MSNNKPWTDFEHQIWSHLKRFEFDQKEYFFLCVSGGLDSMVLLSVLLRLKPQAQFTVAYYHHGISDSQDQQNYRDQSFDLVKNTCAGFSKISFISEVSSTKLISEADCRTARWEFIKRNVKSNQTILTGHHLDDWVETLTLKLIRGVGAEGFTAFTMWDGSIFRPFLETKKEVLQHYANAFQLNWIDDPSNDSPHYLRNWLRNDWFKSLDEKNPAGYENYSRSLLRLSQELAQNQTLELSFFGNNPALGMDRNWFLSLNFSNQKKAIALFLRHHSILNTTAGQIAEIQKRLDKNQKDITFTIGPVNWLINVNQIMIEF